MSCLDNLIYSPERLVCTEREKDACLETVRKLIRLCYEIRRNGVLAAGTPALECGGSGTYDNGSGSLMRILPIALDLHRTMGPAFRRSGFL